MKGRERKKSQRMEEAAGGRQGREEDAERKVEESSKKLPRHPHCLCSGPWRK